MNDFLNPNVVHKALGDYWYSIYTSREQVRNLVATAMRPMPQVIEAIDHLERSLSRHTIPVYRNVFCYPLRLRESVYRELSQKYARFNGEYQFDTTLTFDVPVGTQSCIPVPGEFVTVGSITNKLLEPTVVWNDLVVNNQIIELPGDPFNLDFPVTDIYDNSGNKVDREVILYLNNCRIDKDDLYTQFGYTLGIRLSSSEQYKQLINVLMDSLVNGPSYRTTVLFLSAITGIPAVMHQDELVTSVTENTVVTDKHTYHFSPNDTITVTPGQQLHAGDTMSTGLRLCLPGDSLDGVRGVALNNDYITYCLNNSLVFENRDIPIDISTRDNLTWVKIPVLGDTTDVHNFQEYVWIRGIEGYVPVTDQCILDQLRDEGLPPPEEEKPRGQGFYDFYRKSLGWYNVR